MMTGGNTPHTLTVKVIPRAKKTESAGLMSDGALKVRVKAVPEDGKVNAELCCYLGEVYASEWQVIAGHTGTRKVVRRVL